MVCHRLLSRVHWLINTLQVTLNGEEFFDMKSLASYVEQSDALLGVLTVQETIYFSARLR